ncbi:D-3-phosphoglycerate dehydrogenase [Thermocatellispora tengchongensis]|uniref:D-3-phosphoglycerate dehydrogenase n=1 Tax=Thermocatellispora tengchongensis TaxID=1073253 RepID=A0A840P921_9ACTN|nr:2-hydroxyacid dehydrogenase [Thermocatellispora tengchongensis]MBB5135126.1 D-3-phosphoglycerate dehydrogenase [Thermocatellispora tengchongensis]
MTEQGPWRLLALAPLPEDAVRAMLGPLGEAVTVAVPAARERGALLDALAEAEIVVGDWTAALALDAEAVRAAPRLAFVQQPSVGVDGHDPDALAAAGVPLANTAGVSAAGVAEWCLASALALSRKLPEADAAVRAGEWPQLGLRPRELGGLRVGIVGFGPIGARAAELFGALGCAVSYWSRRARPPEESRGAEYLGLDELVAASDVLVLVIALSEETRGLIGAERLARMPAGALLVNAARGGVVDQAALVAALERGHLGGAALDVFATEPLPPDDPLRSLPHVLLSPHVAGSTPQSTTRLVARVLDNVRAAVEGRPVEGVVNGVSPVVVRRAPG